MKSLGTNFFVVVGLLHSLCERDCALSEQLFDMLVSFFMFCAGSPALLASYHSKHSKSQILEFLKELLESDFLKYSDHFIYVYQTLN